MPEFQMSKEGYSPSVGDVIADLDTNTGLPVPNTEYYVTQVNDDGFRFFNLNYPYQALSEDIDDANRYLKLASAKKETDHPFNRNNIL